ncbi:cyclic 2,3-diphosphoglycerate synthase [candidate division KSB1 bacterium]|nr:cyclic 2,3-diphosphoglycerate synthase [candidate division KSB1 bacterium]
MSTKKVMIMGAAGRDFHNFNVYFRDNPAYQVVAFTATQIPDIDGRKYPADLAGKLYPNGIEIESETELVTLIQKHQIDEVYFSYSDIRHEFVMHQASKVIAAGASFVLLGTRATMLTSKVPVIAICAVRTGCGKSQTTRRVSQILKEMGKKVVAIRHPMPYGDLSAQRVQRFASLADLDLHQCTIEEREEYEPHIVMGNVIYAGVDYGDILAAAEKEADVILWDGGNNDFSFYRPNLLITVVDPLRPGHEMSYHPGEVNARLADVVVINKEEVASLSDIEQVRANIKTLNPKATIVDAASPLFIENPELIDGKRVLVVEDGPTLTHGEMKYGAGVVAAEKYGAREIIDPRAWVSGSIKATFEKYPGIGRLLPAMGYGNKQIADLEETIDAIPADAVIIATPIDLTRIIKINKPTVRVQYELQEIGRPTLTDVLARMKW